MNSTTFTRNYLRATLVILVSFWFAGIIFGQAKPIYPKLDISPRVCTTPGDDSLVFQYSGDDKEAFKGALPGVQRLYGYGTAKKLVFSPYGTYFAVITSIGFEIFQYNGDSFNPLFLRRFISKSEITDLAFTKDNEALITGSQDGTISNWALNGSNISVMGKLNSTMTAFAMQDDGKRFLTGSQDGSVLLWDASNGTNRKVEVFNAPVSAVALSSTGKFMAAADSSGRLVVYNEAGGVTVGSYEHFYEVTDIEFSADETYVASSGMDNFMRVMHIPTGKKMWIGIHDGFCRDISISWNSQYVLSAGEDGKSYLWNFLVNEDYVKPVINVSEYPLTSVAFSKDDSIAGYIIGGRGIYFYNIDKIKAILTPKDNEGKDSPDLYNFNTTLDWKSNTVFRSEVYTTPITSMELRSDSTLMVTGHGDGSVYLWDTKSGKSTLINKHSGEVMEVHFSSDGTQVLSCSTDSSVKLWKGESNVSDTVSRLDTEAFCADFDTNNRWIAAGGSNKILLWNVYNGRVKYIPLTDIGIITNLMYTKDDTSLLCTTNEGKVFVVDLASGSISLDLSGHTDNVTTLYKSPKGIVTASMDRSIQKWNIESKGSETLEQDIGLARYVRYNTDAQAFILIADGYDVHFYNLVERKRHKLYTHTSYASSIAIEDNDNVIYSSGYDGVVRVFDLSKAQTDIGEIRPSDRLNKSFKLEGVYRSNRITVVNNLVVFHPQRGSIVCADKLSGTTLWTKEKEVSDSSPLIADNKLFFTESRASTLVCLDMTNGKEIWRKENVDVLQAGSGFAYLEGFLYTSGVSKSIKKINASNGEVVWTFDTGVTMTTSPILVNKILYIGGDGGYFVALDTESGKEVWVNRDDAQRYNGTQPVRYQDNIFMGKYSGELYVFNKDTGKVVKTLKLGDKITTLPAVNGKYLYVTDWQGKLFQIDMEELKVTWSKEISKTGNPPRIAADTNHIYISNINDKIMALDINNGTTHWEYTIPSGENCPVEIVVDGMTLWAITENGNVYKINKAIKGE